MPYARGALSLLILQLASGATGCGAATEEGVSACGEGETNPVDYKKLTFAKPTRYLVSRTEYIEYARAADGSVDKAAEPSWRVSTSENRLGCNEPSCTPDLSKLRLLMTCPPPAPPPPGGFGGGESAGCGKSYSVLSDGTEVRVVEAGAFGAEIAPIDSKDEAFLMMGSTYGINCSMTYRVEANGSYVINHSRVYCEDSTRKQMKQPTEVVVTRDGAVSQRDVGAAEDNGPCPVAGRRPEGFRNARRLDGEVGSELAACAALEAASIPAFARLARELRILGAPHDLVVAARAAMEDEVAHARVMRELAARYGAVVPKIDTRVDRTIRTPVAIAIENVIEGCVRETLGAVVAEIRARTATDPAIAAAMTKIAEDEARHAELALRVHGWLDRLLDDEERAAVRAASQKALAELTNAYAEESAEAMELGGLPDAATTRGVAQRLAEVLPALLAAA